MSPSQQLLDGVQAEATTAVGVAVGGIVAIGLLAFGIKGLWIGWRAGSKAMGKAGS